jgi:acyl-lipid omega-6 desaturase (Delta-12 desaturase)
MESTIKKSDFVLTPYMKTNDLLATWQIINTIVPYLLLWVIAVKLSAVSLWFLPPIVALMTLFSVRSFSLMHDCGHYSLFRSKRANRIVGFCLGVINAIPQYGWSRDHAFHHKTNGDWERYRGVADFLSTDEFKQLTPAKQRLYSLLRQPWMAIPGGFFYLAIQPRMILVLGLKDLVAHVLDCVKKEPGMGLGNMISSHKSKHWLSATEFWDLLFNNICVLASWVVLSHFLGAGFFWSVYSAVLTCSAFIFIIVFCIQHIFEGAYANRSEGWDYILGAVEGSSYLKLPAILNWFTADIGYHNIHHLSERIPNYNLAACHEANIHLLATAKTLEIQDILGCFKYLLWDADSESLVSIESLQLTSK